LLSPRILLARSTQFLVGILAPLDLAPQIVERVLVLFSGVIVATMRFSDNGLRMKCGRYTRARYFGPLEDIANTKRIRAVVLAGRYLDRTELDRMLKSVEKAAAASGGAPAAHGSAQ
jgi:hypothetical protein